MKARVHRRIVPGLWQESWHDDDDDAAKHDDRAEILRELVLCVEQQLGDEHGARDGGLLQKDDHRALRDVVGREALHEPGGAVEHAHDGE